MPSRRLSTNSNLAPVQELGVQPFSAYNSDNVNMLTRIVSGQKNKDFVVKGLDVRGTNRVNTESAGSVLINETFPNLASFNNNWDNSGFSWDGGSFSAKGSISIGTTATVTLQTVLAPLTTDIGYWFKVEFDLTNTPKQLFVQCGSESKIYEYPTSATYSLYVQLYNNSGTFEPLKFVAFLDSSDTYSDPIFYITNIKLTKILNRGTLIDPIAVPELENPDTSLGLSLDHTNISEARLHPHESVQIFPGVAIKDEVMINMLGVNPTDTTTPLLTLTYNDPDSWIKGVPFQAADFAGTSYYIEDGVENPVTFTAGVLNITLRDDGEVLAPGYRKIKGKSGAYANPAVVQWAYVVMYYSFFKNPDPNKAYLGLAKESEITDPRYGEDYMILAKLRFVDINTVDAIIYYPDRKDWAFIDAANVTYLQLNQLKHWNYKPFNTSLALDLLADRIYNFKGVLFFPTHQQFKLWTEAIGGSGTGTGHGPKEFLQWLQGMDHDNGYDLMAYVVESNTFWRSHIVLDDVVDSIEIVDGGSGYTVDPIVRVNGENTSAVVIGAITRPGNIITNIAVTNGGSGFSTVPDVEIIPNTTGSGAKARAIMTTTLVNYKPEVSWVEVTPKRFEVNWSNLPLTAGWPTAPGPANWLWHRESDGALVDIAPQPAYKTLDEAKLAWPNEYYIERGTSTNPGFTIVNPYNPQGRGLVPGPDTNANDILNNKFLRSDGTWAAASGGQDLHFEAKGYLAPTTNLVQGMVGHNGLLKGVHIWSDTPIDSAAPGLVVDVLLTKRIDLGSGYDFVTASIFNNSDYVNVWGQDNSLLLGLDGAKEFLLSTGWTSANWTGSWSAGWTHTTGNTTALTQSKAAVNGKKYRITISISGSGVLGGIIPTFGGVSHAAITATGTTTYDITAVSTGVLSIVPTATFVRTVLISITEPGLDLTGTALEYPDANTISLPDYNTNSVMPDIYT